MNTEKNLDDMSLDEIIEMYRKGSEESTSKKTNNDDEWPEDPILELDHPKDNEELER